MTMSKSLSEQVAELERQITEVWDIAEAWKLDSVRHWKRVEELEAERDDLQRQVQEAREENAELRAGQGRWPKEESALKEMATALDSQGSTTIRQGLPELEIVTAETIRQSEPGSTWEWGGSTWEWDGHHMQIHDHEGGVWGDCFLNDFFRGGAPRPTRSTVAPRGAYDTLPRLTVHQLNVAPVGSVVLSGTLLFTKNHHGDWINGGPHLGYLPHEVIAYLGGADATLTYPEDQS